MARHVSNPMKSASSNGPIGWFAPSFNEVSILSTVPEALRLTAQDLEKLGVADHVIPEPVGGAQRDFDAVIQSVADMIKGLLAELSEADPKKRVSARRRKYLDMGSKALVA